MLFSLFDKILCTILGLPGPFGMLASIIVIFIFAFAFLMIGLLLSANKKEEVIPKTLWIPFSAIKKFFSIVFHMFKPKSTFVSVPLEYKKQLNNDGGIGWVPYYGKPGRSCKEDKDCPTFQKCNENKCVIPPGVR